jgi:hypothetical protein
VVICRRDGRSAAGDFLGRHDRCIIPIKPEHIEAWLNPDHTNLAAQYAILDGKAQPFYTYRLAT